MERNASLESVPDEAAKKVIPTIYISTAMKVIAHDLGGEQLHKTITTLIETSDPEVPSVAAIAYLADNHSDSLEYVFELAEEIRDDDYRWRTSRRFARREERPQWRHEFGMAVLKSMQFSIFGGGMIIPPDMFK
jgi:hypothetical protein